MHWRINNSGATLVAIAALTLSRLPAAQPGFQVRVAHAPKRATLERRPPAGRVAELIAALSSGEPARRDTARRALRVMGSAIAPETRWSLAQSRLANPDSEVLPDGTITSMRYEIPELTVLIHHAEDELRSRAAKVSLRLTNAPLLDMLAGIGAQLDAYVALSSRPLPGFGDWLAGWLVGARGSIDLDSAAYWDVLRVRWRQPVPNSPASTNRDTPMNSLLSGIAVSRSIRAASATNLLRTIVRCSIPWRLPPYGAGPR